MGGPTLPNSWQVRHWVRPWCVSGMRLVFFKTVGSGFPPCDTTGAAPDERVAGAGGVRVGVTGVCGGRVPASAAAANAVAALINGVGVCNGIDDSYTAAGIVADAGAGAATACTGTPVACTVTALSEQALKNIRIVPRHTIFANLIRIFANFIRLDLVLWVSVSFLAVPVPASMRQSGLLLPIPARARLPATTIRPGIWKHPIRYQLLWQRQLRAGLYVAVDS